MVHAFGEAERRRGDVVGGDVDREVDIGVDRVELELARTVVRSLHEIGAAGTDYGVDLVDDEVDVIGRQQCHRVIGAGHLDDEIAAVADAERGAEADAGDGTQHFVDRIGRQRDRRIAGCGRVAAPGAPAWRSILPI